MLAERRFHATAVKLGAYGVLLLGPSGSGKSSMALDLLFLAGEAGWDCGLVGDDVILIRREADALIARGHAIIAGLIEARGIGIAHVKPAGQQSLSHAIQLDGRIERMPERVQSTEFSCLGLTLPCWHVSDPRRAASALLLRLRQDLTQMKQ